MTARRPLVIVGAGGLGREAAGVVRAINAVEPTWDLVGFVDDCEALIDREVDGVPVIGPVSMLVTDPGATADAAAIVCTGRPGSVWSRVKIARQLAVHERPFATLVHPHASVAVGTVVGPGSLILAGAVVTAPIEIGAHVVAMPHVVFTHDDDIREFTTFASGAMVAGDVTVYPGAYIGAGAMIRERLRIGYSALIGMGSVVTHDVPAGEIWVGNPARPLRAVPGEGRRRPLAAASGGSLDDPTGTSASPFIGAGPSLVPGRASGSSSGR